MSFAEFWLAMGKTGSEVYARSQWGKLSAADKAAIRDRLSGPRVPRPLVAIRWRCLGP